MASKVAQDKLAQGYTRTAACCKTCKHFSSKTERLPGQFGQSWVKESSKRCGIGGFAVMSSARCRLFEER